MLVPDVVPPQVQDLAFPFVELREIPVCTILQPVEVPLDGSASVSYILDTLPGFVSSTNLLKVHSVPLSRSLMKMLDSICPRN